MDVVPLIIVLLAFIIIVVLAALLASVVFSKNDRGPGWLLRIKGEGHNATEEAIKDMVAENAELMDDEKRMIHEIINLGDATVREVMQPRVDMILVEASETVKQALDRMHGTGYSRLPVYEEDYDRIVGVAYYKDLIAPLMEGKENDPVKKYAFEALFVPETKELYPLLSEMQTNRQQMAIVVDEYGGTDGLITLEDIVEEIVGEIVDETDLEARFITPLSEDEWLADGRLTCEEAAEQGWPVLCSGEYETIAGWFMETIDKVPQSGDELKIEGYLFKVQSMRRRRISIVRVRRLLDEGDPEEQPAQD